MTQLICVARLGVGGSIRQIGGPQEKSQEDRWNGPKCRVSFAIYEIVWGKAGARETFSASSQTGFSREDDQDLSVMTRARTPVTRVCIYHVNNADAGKSHSITGECLAHMMYECAVHQVSVIGGDANKMAYQKQGQQRNASYGMSTFQFWLDRMEQTINQRFNSRNKYRMQSAIWMFVSSIRFRFWIYWIFEESWKMSWMLILEFVKKPNIWAIVVHGLSLNLVFQGKEMIFMIEILQVSWNTSIV